MNNARDARCYLRRHLYGVLSTISRKLAGYPFGSVVPCVTDHAARPLILISALAEHTKNIRADPRVSLLVRDDGGDAQEGARLTLIGDALPAPAERPMRARYLRYFPTAERLLALGDFSFFTIQPTMLRYIGGFGAIHWVPSSDYAPPSNTLAESEADIVSHMNTDHTAAMRICCRHFRQSAPVTVTMLGIDCDGFDIRADTQVLRFDFAQPIADASTARATLKAMVDEARA